MVDYLNEDSDDFALAMTSVVLLFVGDKLHGWWVHGAPPPPLPSLQSHPLLVLLLLTH